jgi:hypothetical protein
MSASVSRSIRHGDLSTETNRKDPICLGPYLYVRDERSFNKIRQCRRVVIEMTLAGGYLAFVKLLSIRIRLRANDSLKFMERFIVLFILNQEPVP